MFRNSFQSGFLSVFYSLGSKPLQLWSISDSQIELNSEIFNKQEEYRNTEHVGLDSGDDSSLGSDSKNKEKTGIEYLDPIERVSQHVLLVKDSILQSQVLRLSGDNIPNIFILCPSNPTLSLGIKLPIAVLLARNLGKFFSIEFEIIDEFDQTRRFRASNFQIHTRVTPEITTMPIRLDDDWNQIIFDLDSLSRQCYSSRHKETSRIIIHPNAHIRRLYFTSEIIPESQLPTELRLFIPTEESS